MRKSTRNVASVFRRLLRVILVVAWAEDRATLASDLSADPGAKMHAGMSSADIPASFLLLADWHERGKRMFYFSDVAGLGSWTGSLTPSLASLFWAAFILRLRSAGFKFS